MKIENGKIVMETRECGACDGTAKISGRKTCPDCRGTQRGKRGGRGGCRSCRGSYPYGTVYDNVNKVPCHCGTGIVPENNCDAVPDSIFKALPVKVYRHSRPISFNESFLGIGCVYSVGDYGRAMGRPDSELVADVRNQTCVQAINIIDAEGTVCDHLGVFVNSGGYSVRACFSPDGTDAARTLATERSYAEGLAVGTEIAAAGGNGTLGAVYQ